MFTWVYGLLIGNGVGEGLKPLIPLLLVKSPILSSRTPLLKMNADVVILTPETAGSFGVWAVAHPGRLDILSKAKQWAMRTLFTCSLNSEWKRDRKAFGAPKTAFTNSVPDQCSLYPVGQHIFAQHTRELTTMQALFSYSLNSGWKRDWKAFGAKITALFARSLKW